MADYKGYNDQNDLYVEQTLDELQSMAESMDNNLNTCFNTYWSYESIQEMGLMLETLNDQDEINTNDLWRLAVKLGRIARKLDLTGSKATRGTLLHTYGLFCSAMTVTENGGQVHLIEGVSAEGFQLMADVDMVFSDTNGRFQCDYTNDSQMDQGMMKIHDRESKDRKYTKLLSSLMEGCVPLVISYGVDQSMFNHQIVVPLYTNCPREDDFKFADYLIEKSRDLSYDDVKTMMCWYSQKLDLHTGDGSKMIETPSPYVPEDISTSLLEHCSTNDYNSAFAHEMFCAALESRRSDPAYKSAKMNHYYAIDQVAKLNMIQSKRLIPVLSSERGMHHSDPFERLTEINSILAKRGLIVNLFWKMIEYSSTQVLKGSDVSDGLEIDYDYMSDVTIQRVRHAKSGGIMKAVKLTFPKDKSLKGYQNFLKSKDKHINKILSHVQLEEQLDDV